MQTRARARAVAAEELRGLAEQVLHACGAALYPHLTPNTRRAMRLVSKTALHAIDSSARHLRLDGFDIDDDTSALRTCGSRWPDVERLTVAEFSKLQLDGCMLPPKLKALTFTNAVLALDDAAGIAPLVAVACTLQELNIDIIDTHTGFDVGTHKALASALQQLTSLQSLTFNNGLHHMGGLKAYCSAIASLTCLTKLDLNGVPGEEDDHSEITLLCSSVSALTRLQALRLDADLGREGAEALAVAMAQLTGLQDLALPGCSLGRPAGGQREGYETMRATYGIGALTDAISALTSLTRLDLTNNFLRGSVALLPSQLPKLQSLLLSSALPYADPSTYTLTQVIRRFPTLTSIDLSYNCLGDPTQLPAVSASLAAFTHLRTLNLESCGIHEAVAAVALASTLGSLTQLERLELQRNRLARSDTCRRFAPFWSALARLQALTHLDLSVTGMCRRGLKQLAKVLPQLPQLSYLNISQNHVLSERCAGLLAACLPTLTNLRQLYALGCCWTTQDLTVILPSLKHLQKLEVIVVTRDCGPLGHVFEPAECKVLLSALGQLTGLHTLRMLQLTDWPGTDDSARNASFEAAVLAALPGLPDVHL